MHCPTSQHISYDVCEHMCRVPEAKHISYNVCEHMCTVPEVSISPIMCVSTCALSQKSDVRNGRVGLLYKMPGAEKLINHENALLILLKAT